MLNVFGVMKKIIVCLIIAPAIIGIVACLMLCIAGGVGLAQTPFKPLTVVPVVVGVILLILCIIMVITGVLVFRGLESSVFAYFFVTMRLIYVTVWTAAFLGAIILAVGNFSLRTSLDMVFARPTDEMKTYVPNESLDNPSDWISKTSNAMKYVGVVYVIAFAFLFFSGVVFIAPSGKGEVARVIGAILYTANQFVCGLIVLVPLLAVGRDGLAVLGFKAVKDGTYTGLLVLSVLMLVFAAVAIVFIVLSVKVKPLEYVVHIVGFTGFGISIALIVLSGTVLSQRKAASSNLDAFCILLPATADTPVATPTPACADLLSTYSSNLCLAQLDAADTDTDSAAFDACVATFTLEGFVEKFVAATRSWMGWMGFAVMFTAIYYMAFSCMVCLPDKKKDDDNERIFPGEG